MRNFLYLSPYFPPDTRVGALRPLKFVRHLPALGLRPVVLADAPQGARDERLLGAIPSDVVVVHDYGPGTRRRWKRPTQAATPPWLGALSLSKRLRKPFEQPELVPLGPHAFDIPHALRAARRLLGVHRCEAILVNADPFASAVVGALLARLSGLPLIVDFRDPWALCTLRRPLRKPWVACSVDALERFVVSTAKSVILNTESARRAYAAHYPDLGEQRFSCIPNHADPSLHAAAELEPAPRLRRRFELLLAGTLRRFVDGDVLLELLSDRVGLTIAGRASERFLGRALELGVAGYLQLEEPVSYMDVPALQRQADLLVVLGHEDRQRIPAKIYDAALSDRPLLVISENPELCALAASIGGARVFDHGAVAAMADWIGELLASESQRVQREFSWTSAAASERLAEILCRAT
jgi:hypothetical protein